MKICGIICEYNPFHNGHLFQINYLKKTLGFNFVVIALSGSFSQRALPCCLDKYSKTKCIQNADMVCQIPTAYSINNAEVFALAGVKTLHSVGVDYICFGVEDDDPEIFFEMLDNLTNENEIFKNNLKENLDLGLNFKQANLISIQQSFPNGKRYAEVLEKPNNILAFEYLKAIKKCNYNIQPIFLKRSTDFKENSKTLDNTFASASKIRLLLENNENVSNLIPNQSFQILNKFFNKNYLDSYYNMAYCMLLNLDINKLQSTYLVSEGIENRMLNSLEISKNYEEFLNNTINKRFDKNKINRIVLNYILGVDKQIIKNLYNNKFDYVKVLLASKDILKVLNPNTKLIIRKKDITKIVENSQLEIIENKSNLLSNYIHKQSLPYKDIFVKCMIK
ncbi:MAG: nucleotidyltransferase family protein [Clostridia bacterium]|nr:nucleotidyltransferase family protein [Clostridia bacterium]